MNNSANWAGKEDRAEKAKKFVEAIREKYPDAIKESIEKTLIYTGKKFQHPKGCRHVIIFDDDGCKHTDMETGSETPVRLMQATTDGALFSLGDTDKRTVVLNFASYKNAGGCFINGAMAQEEALCHVSTLYPVISAFEEKYYEPNRHNLNRGLYTDRALYSRDIIFFDKDGGEHKADVITCASPNNSIAFRYEARFSGEENEKALSDRIKFIRDICLNVRADNVILGAWGCGVFAQDPFYVATEFRKAFENTGINCIYAIPDEKNYGAFRNAFDKYDRDLKQTVNKTEQEQELER